MQEECSYVGAPARPGSLHRLGWLAKLVAVANQRHEPFPNQVLGQYCRRASGQRFPAAVVPFVRYEPNDPGVGIDCVHTADHLDATAERQIQVDQRQVRPRVGEELDGRVRIRDRTCELHIGLSFYENPETLGQNGVVVYHENTNPGGEIALIPHKSKNIVLAANCPSLFSGGSDPSESGPRRRAGEGLLDVDDAPADRHGYSPGTILNLQLRKNVPQVAFSGHLRNV